VEKVPLLRHELQIAEVEKWGLSRRGRDEPGMLRDLRWDAAERELRFLTVTGPEVSVVVRRLDATLVVSDEVVGWLRRRHRSSGSTSDAPWDG
jgi:hypothetical protein